MVLSALFGHGSSAIKAPRPYCCISCPNPEPAAVVPQLSREEGGGTLRLPPSKTFEHRHARSISERVTLYDFFAASVLRRTLAGCRQTSFFLAPERLLVRWFSYGRWCPCQKCVALTAFAALQLLQLLPSFASRQEARAAQRGAHSLPSRFLLLFGVNVANHLSFHNSSTRLSGSAEQLLPSMNLACYF